LSKGGGDGMTKEQLIKAVAKRRPDMPLEYIKNFSIKALENILIVETHRDEEELAEEAFIAQL
jgi:hypothetical protein